MLKTLAICSMFLAIGPTAITVPLLAADPRSSDGASEKSHDNNENQPPSTMVSVSCKSPASPIAQQQNNEVHGKDGWDKAAVISNYFLVIIGVFGICYAARTLGKLAKQTKAAEDAAKAASDQTGHMIASERAWLAISSISKSGSVVEPGPPPHYWWQVRNLGKTPARLIATQAVCRISPAKKLPEEPAYPDPTIELHERILGPGDTLDFYSYWERDDGTVFRDNLETLDTIWLEAYGYIKYKTIFGSEICESRFCDDFIHTPDGPLTNQSLRYLIDFRPRLGAPAAYTKHT
jgi:hypothetical protein